MSEHKEPIPSMIYNAAVGGHVTNSQQIIDENFNKEQQDLNKGILEEKTYTLGSDNGMGRIVLRKNLVEGVNILTQSMINKSNTIYIIQYDFDLGGESVTIPENCVLQFDGGSLSNGTIVGQNTGFSGIIEDIFCNVELSGTFDQNLSASMFFNIGALDDTEILQLALYNACNAKKDLYIDRKFTISAPINQYKGDFFDIPCRIIGMSADRSVSLYSVDTCGIKIPSACSLFKSCNFTGQIRDLKIVGERSAEGFYVFDECSVKGARISNSHFTQFSAVFNNTNISNTSIIDNNGFLSCRFFIKGTDTICLESCLFNNYINGGSEEKNGICFECYEMSGTSLISNFIDYYKYIFKPKRSTALSARLPNSIGNVYQVFRYLYIKGENITSFIFNSVGDVVKHIDEDTLSDKDYGIDEEGGIEIPTYVARLYDNSSICIENLKLERPYDNVVYYDGNLLQGAISSFRFTVEEANGTFGAIGITTKSSGFGNTVSNSSGRMTDRVVRKIETNAVELVESLPTPYVNNGIVYRPYGAKVMLSNTRVIYEFEPYELDGKVWAYWKPINDENLEHRGNVRPTYCPLGFTFFDTTINKLLIAQAIERRGSSTIVTWVDATGTPV